MQGVVGALLPEERNIEIDTRHTVLMLPDPQPRQSVEQEELENELAARLHLQEREDELLPLAVRVTQSLLPFLSHDARDASFGAIQHQNSSFSNTGDVEPLPWSRNH